MGRIPAPERRALVIAAAREVFAQHGYHGASTDTIAQAAGVSQGYVVRLFGTKRRLFARVVRDCLDVVRVALASAGDSEASGSASAEDSENALGRSYITVIAENPSALLVLLRVATSGADPELSELARDTITAMYRVLRDQAGLGGESAARLLANGLLTSMLAAIGAHDEPDFQDLIRQTLQGNIDAYETMLERRSSPVVTGRRSTKKASDPR